MKWSNLRKLAGDYRLWLVLVLFVVIAILHYPQLLLGGSAAYSLMGLERHAFDRILLLLPIGLASYAFGLFGGVISLIVAGAIMLPRDILISQWPTDALYESTGIMVMGSAINLWFHMHRRGMAMLRRQEGALTSIINGSPIPAFTIDEKHRVTHWNLALESLTGIRYKDIAGTSDQWRAFYNSRRPVLADLVVAQAPDEAIESRYPGKIRTSTLIRGAYEAEDFFPELGQSGLWLHFTASPIRADDQVIGALETLEDTTVRKQAEIALAESEKSFRQLFDTALDAIWVHDLEGNIRAINGSAAKLLGYSRQKLLRANIKQLLSDESLALIREVITSLARNATPPTPPPYELTLIRWNGTRAICMVATNSVVGNKGQQLFQNIARDITEERRLYEELRYYMAEVTRAQEEERKRISRELHDGVSQTLIVLLRKLDNFVHQSTALSKSDEQLLQTFDEQIRQALKEVRHFGRDLRPSILDDLGLVPALEWLCDQLQNEHGIEARLRVTGSQRKLSHEAELLLFRIIQEATRNIAKHSRATQAEILFKFDRDRIVVSIKDNGIGFKPPETLGSLPRGGKLGLAGMQERVRLLGGSMRLESKPGKGTTVLVEVPM